MIRGVVFAHVNLGAAFCEAVESFVGPQEDLVGLSNADLSAESMPTALAEAIGPAPGGAIIFTALFGGSCWQAAERHCREHSDCHHLTGTNLPMLLTFVTKRATVGLEELVDMLHTYGREGIRS